VYISEGKTVSILMVNQSNVLLIKMLIAVSSAQREKNVGFLVVYLIHMRRRIEVSNSDKAKIVWDKLFFNCISLRGGHCYNSFNRPVRCNYIKDTICCQYCSRKGTCKIVCGNVRRYNKGKRSVSKTS